MVRSVDDTALPQDEDITILRNVRNNLQLQKAQPHKISVSINTSGGRIQNPQSQNPPPLYETRMEITEFARTRQSFNET